MKQVEMQHPSARPRRQPVADPQATEPGQWEQPIRPARRARWEATLALLAVAIISAGVATLFIVEMWLADRVLPGVYAWDVDLGGLTREAAMARLEAEFRYPADRHPVLRYGDQTWPVDPGELGTQLDVGATVDVALTIGHRGDLATRLREQADVLINSTLVLPSFSFDPGTGSMFLSGVARQVNRPLRNATLSLGEELRVEIVPGQVGREVDEEATRQALTQRIAQLAGGEVPLAVRESQPLLADLSAAQVQVQRILSDPVVLTAPGFEPWTIEPPDAGGAG